jgi:hypothetical protein
MIPPSEVEFIQRAAKYLENPSFMVRLADLVGIPLEGALGLAPPAVSQAVSISLRRALDFAVFTLPKQPRVPADHFPSLEQRVWWTGYRHSAVTAVSGGVAGLFGTLGLCAELPVTTCLMLRSMSAISTDFGEDAHDIQVRLECLSLFGVGGPSNADDEMDASYLAVRASMNSLVKHAAKFVSHTPSNEILTSINNGTAPTLVKLLGKIARRFEFTVSEKLMAQAIPFVGALGGATVNVLFTEHFNAVARFHFGLRNLERRWGESAVRAIYQDAASKNVTQSSWQPARLPDYTYRGDGDFSPEATKPR